MSHLAYAEETMAPCDVRLLRHSSEMIDLYVSASGSSTNRGTKESPLSFSAAIHKVRDLLKADDLPDKAITFNLLAGHYHFDHPFVLGPEFQGTAEYPIVIRAVENAEVVFDGSVQIPLSGFASVSDPDERARLASSATDQIVATTITDPVLIAKFNKDLMLNLIVNEKQYLPSVFPNDGYAKLKSESVTPERTPPGIPVGDQAYGIRAGCPPHQEPGKPLGWKGTLQEPRGARVGFVEADEHKMAGTWLQWEHEIKRNNTRNTLTGFIEANWLLSSQPIVSASGQDKCIHLTRALAYVWAWKNVDKPLKVFGLLCELDSPGEWHFDPLSNRLFLYPPEPLDQDTVVSLSVAPGFIHLDGASYISIIGLSVQNVGSGSVYETSSNAHHNLIAGGTIRNSTATGIEIDGTFNAMKGCDLIDLNRHIVLRGGRQSPSEITPGRNAVENCHIYQKNFRHEKVNISISGVGNRFKNNLVHNSLGQAVTVKGNDHVVELCEFFNIGFDEGDGGAVYSGADLTGYGIVYRHNFFHHLMHVPGKVERSGIHLDDLQAGATCVGNVFYKSAGKGIFMNGGAGHTLKDNVFLEGYRGIYNVGHTSQKNHDQQVAALRDPNHMYRNTKENYVGRAEKIVGEEGWTKSPWKERYPLLNEVMSDTGQYGRMWPIRCVAENNLYYGNTLYNHTEWSRVHEEAMKKTVIQDDREISPDDFVDYNKMNFQFNDRADGMPEIPFHEIGLKLDAFRKTMPSKEHYRNEVKEFFDGINSMPGTEKQIDTAKVVEEGPIEK